MQFSEEAREAMRQEMQAQAEVEQEAARAQIAAQWVALESALPATESRDAPVLTLYRDTNGWCPFCERVWLQLEQKGLPYEEVLISLKDKPAWYLEMVPTGLVPAVKIESSGEVCAVVRVGLNRGAAVLGCWGAVRAYLWARVRASNPPGH
jgi:glutaredoxin